MKDGLLKVNILGVNLTLKSEENPEHLKQVVWFLNRKIEEIREKHKSADQLMLSILSSIYIVDELINLKNSKSTDHEEKANQTDIIITEELNRTFQRVLDVLDTTVNEK